MDWRFYIFGGVGGAIALIMLYLLQIFVTFTNDYVLAYLTLGIIGSGIVFNLWLYEKVPAKYAIPIGVVGWLIVIAGLFCYVNGVFLPKRF
jgi:hypothetical protein